MVTGEALRRLFAAWRAAIIADLGDRRFAPARFVAPLAVVVLVLGVAFAAGGYFFAYQADARQEARQRIALGGAIDDIRARRGNPGALDARDLRILERNSGLADLKLETEPATAGRSVQPLLGENGRITAWLSWRPERPISDLFLRWWPMAALLLIFLCVLAWLSIWQLRRALRVLDAAE
ncbi:MAG: hypothetical protein HY659_09530, partial [Rhizobiales bacterium]|nr:hypothetical protein [Hyphomicrobiales bacterium]